MPASAQHGTPAPTLAEWQRIWKLWDAATLDMIPRDDITAKPLQLRHPFIFYLGHLPAFTDARLSRVLQQQPTEPAHFAVMFARGIDPDLEDPSRCHSHSPVPDQWPKLSAILQYRDDVRARITALYKQHSSNSRSIAHNIPNRVSAAVSSGAAAAVAADTAAGSAAAGDLAAVAAMPADVQHVLWMCFEHEAMHLETFMYMLVQYDKVQPPPSNFVQHAATNVSWCSQRQQKQQALAQIVAGTKQPAVASSASHTVSNGTPTAELLPLPAAATWVLLPAGAVTMGYNGARKPINAPAAAIAADLAPSGPVDDLDSSAPAASAAAAAAAAETDGLCMFGWDNECPARRMYVESCLMQHRPVCVLEYLNFLAQQVLRQIKSELQQQGQEGQQGHVLVAKQLGAASDGYNCSSSSSSDAEKCSARRVGEMLAPGGVLHHLIPLSIKVADATAVAAAGGSADPPRYEAGSTAPHTADNVAAAAAVCLGSRHVSVKGCCCPASAADTAFAILQQLVSVKTVLGSVSVSTAGYWPIYCSALQAAAYAAWWDSTDTSSSSSSSSSRLPSEAELLLARQYDADCLAAAGRGSAAAHQCASASTISVDFQIWHPTDVQLELESIQSLAAGTAAAITAQHMNGHSNGQAELLQSANGHLSQQQQQQQQQQLERCLVSQLCDNGWEWSSTMLTEHEGFKPHPLYPEYSVDFFDGKHHVLLGGSWATVQSIADRGTFRNSYQAGQQHVFAKFRLCRLVVQ